MSSRPGQHFVYAIRPLVDRVRRRAWSPPRSRRARRLGPGRRDRSPATQRHGEESRDSSLEHGASTGCAVYPRQGCTRPTRCASSDRRTPTRVVCAPWLASLRPSADFALLVGILFLPALLFDDAGDHAEADPSVYEPTSITSYVADFDVHEDGGMDVVETLTVNFPAPTGTASSGSSTGSTRRRPTSGTGSATSRSPSTARTCPSTGPRRTCGTTSSRSATRARSCPTATTSTRSAITSPARLTPGDDVDEPSQFYWNLVPQGWQQEIAETDLTVHLPEPADDVQLRRRRRRGRHRCVPDRGRGHHGPPDPHRAP